MQKTKVQWIAWILLLILSGCGAIKDPMSLEEGEAPQRVMPYGLEDICNLNYEKSKNGKRLSWKGVLPVVLFFDQTFPYEYVEPFMRAIATWNRSAGKELFRAVGYSYQPSMAEEDGRNIVYFLHPRGTENLSAKSRSTLGSHGVALTWFRYRMNRLTEADIIFDGERNEFDKQNNSHSMEALALHELGHALGLGHNPSNESIMFEKVSKGSGARNLDATTQGILSCEY